ncbi:class I SAM-dependent methyltransferase [Pseudomonas sp. zfem005]|uniref:class I SAM-dependent methyltransferase n=1 Tax=Pseudomonas sp. zfem005 TaxID=3078200 RepID=UPI002928A16E|nr:class I SAM-dependent methyltransferase [Pseudomonas sp. zfem005]MDU9414259.1 class I SAM-dependent methyltransferase [Pseudomonas sp. zfem005]
MYYPLDHLGVAADHPLLRLGQLLAKRGYRFTTITPLSHQRVNARPGNREARTLEDVFGWSRPFRESLVGDELFALLRDADALEAQGELWSSRVRWSSLDGHLFVHSRYPTTDADAVFFGPDTYRFAQALHQHLAGETRTALRIADIGCGAGPGALLAALAKPQAEVLALDINDRALTCTAVNARLAGAANLIPRHSDLLHQVDGALDLIIANPPYMLDPAERAYRHGGGEHGAGLSQAIIEAALERLAPGGSLLLYTGVAMFGGRDPFRDSFQPLLDAHAWPWRYREMDPDVFGEELDNPLYAQADRIAAVVLELTRPANG